MREVEYYIHLREQGESHDKAMAHTMQRHGCGRRWLLDRIDSAVNAAVHTIRWANAAKQERNLLLADQPTEPHEATP